MPDHPDKRLADARLMAALGTVSPDFMDGLLSQLANAALEDALKFMMSVIIGLKPKDQLETMLAAQMAAIYMATMRLARELANVETISTAG